MHPEDEIPTDPAGGAGDNPDGAAGGHPDGASGDDPEPPDSPGDSAGDATPDGGPSPAGGEGHGQADAPGAAAAHGAADELAPARATVERELAGAGPASEVPPLPPATELPFEERFVAALSQLIALLGFSLVPLLVLALIFAAFRERSPYVRFQSAQAFAFALAAAAINWLGWGIVGAGLICLAPLMAIVTVVLVVYPLWGALQTISGQPFDYVWIGSFVRGALDGDSA